MVQGNIVTDFPGVTIPPIVLAERGVSESKIGALPKDSDKNPIQGGRTDQYLDASSTAKTSPLTLSTTEVELVTPVGAADLIIKSRVAGTRHGKQDPLTGGANAEYAVLEASNFLSIPVAGGSSVWVREDTAGAILDFHYIML